MKKLKAKSLKDFTGYDAKQSEYFLVNREDKDGIIKYYVEASKRENTMWYLAEENEFGFVIARVFNRILYRDAYDYRD